MSLRIRYRTFVSRQRRSEAIDERLGWHDVHQGNHRDEVAPLTRADEGACGDFQCLITLVLWHLVQPQVHPQIAEFIGQICVFDLHCLLQQSPDRMRAPEGVVVFQVLGQCLHSITPSSTWMPALRNALPNWIILRMSISSLHSSCGCDSSDRRPLLKLSSLSPTSSRY